MSGEYDYIVVGGGSAGCVLAARLSEDPSVEVLLIERGDAYSRLRLGVPLLGKRNSARYLEVHRTRGQAHCNNRSIDLPVANAMGGGSSVNAMMYVRGERRAYDRWAEQGAAGWDYAGVLPYFRKLEDFEGSAGEYHGKGGPIGVSSSRYRSRFGERFVDACVERGLARNNDFTGAAQGGAGFYQFTQSNGERASAALGYLRPAIRRTNLSVASNATVDRVVVERGRASGVRGRRLANEFHAQARREVILAAGALSTPKLMMLSGLGPADELAALGIEPRVNLSGVGRGLQDHPRFPVVFQPKQRVRISAAALAAQLPRWLVTRKGMLASPLIDAGAFLRVADASELLDCQLVVQWAGGAAERNAIHVNPCLIDVESRGTVTLASADPDVRPIVDPNYLATERERDVAVKALRFIRSLVETHALREFGLAGEILPGTDIRSDAEILEYVRNHVETAYHPAGTCRMGVDEHSVVDPQLRVHGVHGLRIADASVMPSLINGNTNGSTIMIAERAADLILRGGGR